MWLLELGVAAAAETVLDALLNGEPPPPPPLEPLNCLLRSRLAELPRTTPDNVSISFLLGHGLKQDMGVFIISVPVATTQCNRRNGYDFSMKYCC